MKKLLLINALMVSACVIDTVPLPEDKPQDGREDGGVDAPGNASNLLRTDAMYYYGSTPMLFVGAEGAVFGPGTVIIEDAAQSWRAERQARPDGSFVIYISAEIGETLSVSYAEEGVVLATSDLTLEPASVAATSAGIAFADDSGGPALSQPSAGAPSAAGLVTVSAPAGTVAPGIVVVVANLDNFAGTSAVVATNGSFSAEIEGTSGDELVLFPTEPASSNSGGQPFNFFVP